MTIFSQRVYEYGSSEPLPKQCRLQAGPLRLVYENGALRYISFHHLEVVRMIGPAVRDHNWGTVEPSILQENIAATENAFNIDLEVVYKKDDVHLRAGYRISGADDGKIRFEMRGEALASFRKNRIGFCILHPVNECAGKVCEITHVDGRESKEMFPELVSPHQPFMNIGSMRWPLQGQTFARLNFEGDIFESEDQRNWTDASYKTYCTPLELPFPAWVQKGEQINQVVELVLEGVTEKNAVSGPAAEDVANTFNIFPKEVVPLPQIGTSRSTEVQELTDEDIRRIRKVGFEHYRVDVKLFEEGWKDGLPSAGKEAVELGLALEIALHMPSEYEPDVLHECIDVIVQSGVTVYAILLFQQGTKVAPKELFGRVLPAFRENFPGAKIGGGTDAYFTELNRNYSSSEAIDFLSFSINPQVHAFDNASLVETLEAQGFVVSSAKVLAEGKAVHISPVTLKPRFNPDATDPEKDHEAGQLPAQVDVRQRSLFGAGWTVGSIKYLAEAGAESITYFETAGRKGLFMSANSRPFEDAFPADKGEVFPVYAVLKELLDFAGAEVVKSKSNKPLHFDGLVLKKGEVSKIFLANFRDRNIEVVLPAVTGQVKMKVLNAEVVKNREWHMDPDESLITADKALSINLKAFEIAIIIS